MEQLQRLLHTVAAMKINLFEHPREDHPVLAIGLLMIAVFAFAFQDSLVKLMSSYTSFWQFQTLRSIGNVSFTLMLAAMSGGLTLIRPVNPRPVYLRAMFVAVCMFCFFASAPFLSIAQMAAGLYTYPIFVSLLAGPILGEQVGPWRIGAILVGGLGAAIVISPWDSDFSPVQVLPLIAGIFYACNILTLRRGCRKESPLALAFSVGMVFLVSGIAGITLLTLFPLSESIRAATPFVAIGWPELTLLIFGFAVLASVLNLTANICMTRAYQTADASLLAPLDFIYLLFIAVWGKILFDQWPTGQALIGMILIATAGVLIGWREQVIKRKSFEI
ncbi:MAG: DMT family transporter [Gammaproteobacteria bacterium]|nr:DMT family transporter [Gammaproteobacteria bacterium]